MRSEFEQIRQEVLLRGPDGLLDSQLLGLVLSDVNAGKRLCYRETGWQEGITKDARHKTRLLALAALAKRMVASPVDRGTRLTCAADISGIYLPRLSNKSQEHFMGNRPS